MCVCSSTAPVLRGSGEVASVLQHAGGPSREVWHDRPGADPGSGAAEGLAFFIMQSSSTFPPVACVQLNTTWLKLFLSWRDVFSFPLNTWLLVFRRVWPNWATARRSTSITCWLERNWARRGINTFYASIHDTIFPPSIHTDAIYCIYRHWMQFWWFDIFIQYLFLPLLHRTIDLLDWNSLIDDTTEIANLLMVPNLEVRLNLQRLKTEKIAPK